MKKRVLAEGGEFLVECPDGLLMTPPDVERTTGWALKPEGLCRGELCVPLAGALREGHVDVEAFWRKLGSPVFSDDAGETWVLGTGAEARKQALRDLEAPDFELPDVNGIPRRLSSLRGKKVFLATWASW